MSTKVISYSLWGDIDTYNVGAICNAIDAKVFFPSFECWFYIHKESVPSSTVNALLNFPNVKIILKDGDLKDPNIKPMTWRFEAIDQPLVSIMMPRDTDSRFLYREQLAVLDWLNSGKTFHIMRDHPHHHFKILGGMFGTRKIPDFNWTKNINLISKREDRNYDQEFLAEHVYPLIKNDVIIHSNFIHFEGEKCINFPVDYDLNLRFVGEYIFADGSRSEPHLEILKNHNLIYQDYSNKY
jgi:hypothetical protein